MNKEINTLKQRYVSTDLCSSSSLIFVQALFTNGLFGTGGGGGGEGELGLIRVDTMDGLN